MDKIKDKVIKKLQYINVGINNENDMSEDEHMIATEDSIIVVNEKDKNITVSYHVASDIQDSVILALALNDIDEAKVFVSDTFMFDDNGKYVDGEDAKKLFEDKKAEMIIDGFMKHQSEKHFLANAHGFHC